MSGTRKWAQLQYNVSLTPGELWTGLLMPWRGEGTYLDPPVSLHRLWAARFPAPGLTCTLSWKRRLPVAEGRFSEKGVLGSCYQPTLTWLGGGCAWSVSGSRVGRGDLPATAGSFFKNVLLEYGSFTMLCFYWTAKRISRSIHACPPCFPPGRSPRGTGETPALRSRLSLGLSCRVSAAYLRQPQPPTSSPLPPPREPYISSLQLCI